MTSPVALLLHDADKDCCKLRSLIVSVGCKVEKALFDGRPALSAAPGFCMVLFVVKRHAARIVDLIRDWHEITPGACLLAMGGRVARRTSIAMLEAGLHAYLTEPVGFRN